MSLATVTTAAGATWPEVAKDRQRYRDETIAAVEPPLPEITNIPLNTLPVAKEVLSDREIEITELTVEDLAGKIATRGSYTAINVTKAFLRRAALAQKVVGQHHKGSLRPRLIKNQTNCITELLPERALSRAKFLDHFLEEKGHTIGPLHGVPISVKEHIGIKDLDHNAGFVAWVGRTSPVDSHILEILENAGAILYARTTQPQTLMHLETSNNIYG